MICGGRLCNAPLPCEVVNQSVHLPMHIPGVVDNFVIAQS
jgi:hypothetical protein